jgi:nucleotide-binding universal stress UspA family protein
MPYRDPMIHRVIVPHDYSPEAERALAWAAALVHDRGGSLVLLHVILFPAKPIRKLPMIPELRPTEDPADSVAKLRTAAERHRVNAEIDVFETSDAGPGIVSRAAELGGDLVVIGGSAQSRGNLSRAFRASVIDHVVWNASCPVVVVRSPKSKAT